MQSYGCARVTWQIAEFSRLAANLLRIANDKGCAPVAADRIAQNSLLSELPGVAFAFLTLAYIVLSFVSL